MHSLCAFARSSFARPAVFLLHIAILLSGFAAVTGLFDRQVFMNALRSSPFLSPAWSLQAFIFSCCALGAFVVSAALVSAANDGAAHRSAGAETTVKSLFMWGFPSRMGKTIGF